MVKRYRNGGVESNREIQSERESTLEPASPSENNTTLIENEIDTTNS